MKKVYNRIEKISLTAIALVFLSTILGGLSTILYKYQLNTTSYLDVALINSGFLCLFFSFFKGWDILSFNVEKRLYLFYGSLAQALGMIFTFLAISYLYPVEMSFLSRNQVVFSLLLGLIFLKERLNLSQYLAILFSLCGTVCFSFHYFGFKTIKGVVFALIACFCFAFRNFLFKKGVRISHVVYMFWGSLFGFILVLIISTFSRGFTYTLYAFSDLKNFVTVSLITFVTNGIGITLYYKALEMERLSIVASIRSFSPFFVSLYSLFFFREAWTQLKIYGFIFYCLSIWLWIKDGLTKKHLPALGQNDT